MTDMHGRTVVCEKLRARKKGIEMLRVVWFTPLWLALPMIQHWWAPSLHTTGASLLPPYPPIQVRQGH